MSGVWKAFKKIITMESFYPMQDDEDFILEKYRATEAPVGNPLPPEAIAKLDAVMKTLSK